MMIDFNLMLCVSAACIVVGGFVGYVIGKADGIEQERWKDVWAVADKATTSQGEGTS